VKQGTKYGDQCYVMSNVSKHVGQYLPQNGS